MKTLNKIFFSLTFLAFFLIGFTPNAEAKKITNGGETSAKVVDTTATATSLISSGGEDEFDFDFSDPFFFDDKVQISIYSETDELLYSGTFTKEEVQKSAELKSWLKKSEFLLSINNEHYYYLSKE